MTSGYTFYEQVPYKKSRKRIDFYVEELDLYIECNGRQHYDHTEYFHKTLEVRLNNLYRDLWIEKGCRNIICIPYTYTGKDISLLLSNKKLQREIYLEHTKLISKFLKEQNLSQLLEMSFKDFILYCKQVGYKI